VGNLEVESSSSETTKITKAPISSAKTIRDFEALLSFLAFMDEEKIPNSIFSKEPSSGADKPFNSFQKQP